MKKEDVAKRIMAETGKQCPCCGSDENWKLYNEAEALEDIIDFIELIETKAKDARSVQKP